MKIRIIYFELNDSKVKITLETYMLMTHYDALINSEHEIEPDFIKNGN